MTAKVFFLSVKDGLAVEEQAIAIKELIEKSGILKISNNDFVAIKIHVGEKKNTTHIKPELIREIVSKVKEQGGQPFLTETSTLYKGERENAVKHLMHAHRHGFTIENVGAPFIMADGLTGNSEYEVKIDGQLHETVKVAREVMTADALIAVSHPTGHIAAGLGACIKNLGMGLASRMGKMRQHSAMLPEVLSDKCRICQKCVKWCPQEAIIEKDGKAYIMAEKCIGCGECLAVCRFDAVSYDWGAESGYMQRSMAEHAYGSIKDKKDKCVFINVLINMTKDCDCFSVKQEKMIEDIGILASQDPVAVDMATLDLTAKAHGHNLAEMAYKHHDAMIQIDHAAEIGMGSKQYELVEV
ncbi:DUF362 domain-containing protein [Dendrosporobacter sp. 1207_IL3150]|uniref:DUF362 domain-containing protein n=1 Tax=Dendrosporobacter sp. 1207_IL3150 TaxID=3084054 RepID=UPI002FDB5389